MTVIFIINGENVPIELDVDEPLLVGRDRALEESHNTGRPLEEWQLRDEKGYLLSLWDTPDTLGFPDIARLFLTLRVGAGGSFALAC